MKLVGKLQGSCLIRFAPEEIMPESAGVQIPALAALLVSTYQLTHAQSPFQIMPAGAAQGLIPQSVFVNGQYTIDDQPISIKQLAIANNGISVNAQDTDAADKITDHIFTLLNTNLKFRFDAGSLKRKYFSSLVVQFARDFESSIPGLSKIQQIIQSALGRKSPEEVALKRLAFGMDGPPIVQVNLGNIDSLDFVIERRSGQPYSENRYFSSAALKTPDHVRALEEIEATLSS